jgi:hypothetical protein
MKTRSTLHYRPGSPAHLPLHKDVAHDQSDRRPFQRAGQLGAQDYAQVAGIKQELHEEGNLQHCRVLQKPWHRCIAEVAFVFDCGAARQIAAAISVQNKRNRSPAECKAVGFQQ